MKFDKETLKYIEDGILGCLDFEESYNSVNEDLDIEMSNEYDSEGNQLTKKQAEFFRNSKIRDDKGRLLVCYHGTFSKFNVFEKGDIGFHFGTEKQANERVNTVDTSSEHYINKYYLNISNYLYYPDDPGTWKGIYLYDNFIGCVEDDIIDTSLISDENFDKLINCEDLYNFDRLFKDILIKSGYEGIIYPNKYEAHDEYGELDLENSEDSFIAFYSNQIKSIDNKNPTNSNNINEELLEESLDTDKTIKLITRQNKEVLDTLKDNKTYKRKYDKKQFREDCYRELGKYLNYDSCPIFCLPLDYEYKFDDVSGSKGMNKEDTVELILEVPIKDIDIMEYYNWSDYLYYTKEENDEQLGYTTEESLKHIDEYLGEINKDIESYEYPQVVIDRIEPEWLNEEILDESVKTGFIDEFGENND